VRKLPPWPLTTEVDSMVQRGSPAADQQCTTWHDDPPVNHSRAGRETEAVPAAGRRSRNEQPPVGHVVQHDCWPGMQDSTQSNSAQVQPFLAKATPRSTAAMRKSSIRGSRETAHRSLSRQLDWPSWRCKPSCTATLPQASATARLHDEKPLGGLAPGEVWLPCRSCLM
jgi:hypothetical protein